MRHTIDMYVFWHFLWCPQIINVEVIKKEREREREREREGGKENTVLSHKFLVTA